MKTLDAADGLSVSYTRKMLAAYESHGSISPRIDDHDAGIAAAVQVLSPLVAMLRRLEWWGGSCPMCCVERYGGRAGEGMDEHLIPVEPPQHAPDCDLATLLRDLP